MASQLVDGNDTSPSIMMACERVALYVLPLEIFEIGMGYFDLVTVAEAVANPPAKSVALTVNV